MSGKPSFILSLAAVAMAVAGFFSLAQYASRGGEESPLYSIYRADPYGAMALKELLEAQGGRTFALTEPVLPPGAGGTLIQILSHSDYVEFQGPGIWMEQEGLSSKDLARWVSEGNTLLIFCRGNPPAGQRFGISMTQGRLLGWVKKMEESQRKGVPPSKLRGKEVQAQWQGSREGGLKPLALLEPVGLSGQHGAPITPLATTDKGSVALERKSGAGRVVIVGDPSPALNGWLDKGGNLEFVLGLIGDGPVYFDEWSHGVGQGGSLIGLMKKFGLAPALLQIGLALILFHFSGRGAPGVEIPPQRDRVSGLEQINALGRLYGQTMKPAQARQRVADELVIRAHEAAGASAGTAFSIERAPADKRELIQTVLQKARWIQAAGDKEVSKKDLAAALNLSMNLTKERTHG